MDFYKNNPKDRVWWVENPERKGEHLFSFDKQKIYNLFRDYPHALSAAQLKVFDRENPEWREFFSDRF